MSRGVLFVSDLHIGSSVAMIPDNLRVYDGVVVRPSKAQRWIKSKWQDMISDVKKITNGMDLITVFNGDLIDGDHHGTYQLVTADQTEQARMCIEIITPLVDMSSKTVFIRGTMSHVGREGRWDNLISRNFDNVETFGTGETSHWHADFEVDGVRFDVAHFSTQSGIARNSGNAINQLAAETEFSYYRNGKKPPHYAIRSHRHIYKTSGDNFFTEAIQTPAWQLGTSYVRSGANPNSLADIGAVLIICDNGKSEKIVFKHRPIVQKTIKI